MKLTLGRQTGRFGGPSNSRGALQGSRSQTHLHSKSNSHFQLFRGAPITTGFEGAAEEPNLSEDEEYSKQIQGEADFKKAYSKLLKRMNNNESSLLKDTSYNRDHSFLMKSLANSNSEKRFNLQDFQQRTNEFQEKKSKKIAYLQEEKFLKDVQECTFTPNQVQSQPVSTGGMVKSKSASRLGQPSRQQRNMKQFIEDQRRKEEERLMKISLQAELHLMKEKQELKDTPSINSRSKVYAEKKLLEKSLLNQELIQSEAYNRLYEIGKKRQHMRNESDMNLQSPSKSQTGTILSEKEIKSSEHSFHPAIQKKSQKLKRDKSIEKHLYEDFLERNRKKEQVRQGFEAHL